jgi:chromosome transmission fidelity protein 4
MAFMSNCQPDFTVGGKYRVLAWNMVGTVCLREELAYTSVDVDFTDKQLHRNIVINDDYGAVISVLNHSGMILASKGVENPDEEEMDDFIRPDDEDIDMEDGGEGGNEEKKRKRHAHLHFKPFNTWKNLKDWHFALKHGEQVEALAIGSGWCAAATDFGYIRVFSIEGVQRTIISHGTPFVTMAGYENLLAVVYHSGPSVYGCQAFKIKIIDMSPLG